MPFATLFWIFLRYIYESIPGKKKPPEKFFVNIICIGLSCRLQTWRLGMKIEKMKKHFIDCVRRDPLLSGKTKREYIYIINAIPNRILQSRDAKKIIEFYHKKARKTVAQRLSVFRKFYKMFSEPFKDVEYRTHSRDERLKEAFTDDQIDELVRKANSKFMKVIIILLYLTGLRINELLKADLTTSDKYYELNIIGKGKSKAEKVLIPKQNEILRKCLGEYFKIEHKHKKEYYNVWKQFRSLKEKCGIKNNKLTLHSLRHSAAERFQKLYGIGEARRILRHKDFKTTEIYLGNIETLLK
jgi:integrase